MFNTISEKELIDTYYKNYAIYTLESRAIPSIIDGMKPVHRKIMCLALSDAKSKKMKVADFGAISKLGYRHGEMSAQDAAVNLAADWNNNVPLLEGYGDFGSRLCHQSAAPRYIYAKLSPAWEKYFDSAEVCPVHPDPEFVEPAYYLPKIPWVLVNGVQGIAVGFAVNILPRKPEDVVSYCKALLRGDTSVSKTIVPNFPNFKGSVTQGSEGLKHWIVRGCYTSSRNTYRITELPIGWDREKYVDFLNGLVEKGKIKDFFDLCDESGFVFEVKVTNEQKTAIDKDPYKELRLEKSYHENFTLLDEYGKPIVKDTVYDIVEHFLAVRLDMYQKYIEHRSAQTAIKLNFSKDKLEFITRVVSGKLKLDQHTKQSLESYLAENFTSEKAPSLASIPAYSFTTDAIKELKKQADDEEKQLTYWSSCNNVSFYKETLENL